MDYLKIENGVITNIIVADEEFAAQIGAEPYYAGAVIGGPYSPPPDPPVPPTESQLLGQQITILHLASIAQGQKQTDLELALLEQGQYATQKELEGLSNV